MVTTREACYGQASLTEVMDRGMVSEEMKFMNWRRAAAYSGDTAWSVEESCQ